MAMKLVTTFGKARWAGGLEITGMVLILISFYYQAFYEGDTLTARYDNIRFKLSLIHNEVIQNSHLIGSDAGKGYSLGDHWKGFNQDRSNVAKVSEDHITIIDEINRLASSIRAWIFLTGSLLLIVAKCIQNFGTPRAP